MKFKKTMTSLLAIALSMSVGLLQVSAIKFSDLRGYEWAEQYVNDVATKGIVNGYVDGTYKPASPVTRIETLVMIANLHPKSDVDTIYKNNSSKYKDRLVKYNIDEWARPYIVFALEKGIIPNNDKMLKSLINLETKNHINALRYEASVFLVRGLGLENETNSNATLSYKDNKDILSQAVPYIELLQRKGIISKDGDGSGNFNPDKTITRAEMAIMLSRSYKYSAKAKGASSSANPPQTIKQETIRGTINLLTFADDNITIAITTNENKIMNLIASKKSLSVSFGRTLVSTGDIKVGQQGEFTLTNGKLTKIVLDEELVRYSGTLIDFSEADKTLTVKTKDSGNKVFRYTDESSLYLNDKLVSIRELPKNEEIDVYAKGNLVEKASVISTKNEFKGEIIEYNSKYITVRTENGNIKKDLDKELKIYRNNKRVDNITDIAIGDNAKIITNNDKVVEISIDAENKRYLSAEIMSIEMNSYYNKIVIGDSDGNEHILTVTNDTVIRINDVKKDIYSLKIGYKVDVYTKGGLVDEIVSRGEFRQTTVSGKVVRVDTIDKYVEIKQNDGSVIKLYYDNTTKIENLSDGRAIEANKIYNGDSVTGIGILNSGNMNATRMIVEIR